MAGDSLSALERAYATEWVEAEIRVVRHGEKYVFEFRTRNDVGSLCHYTLDIEEREAGSLQEIWCHD